MFYQMSDIIIIYTKEYIGNIMSVESLFFKKRRGAKFLNDFLNIVERKEIKYFQQRDVSCCWNFFKAIKIQ